MPDEIDRACEREQQIRDDALREQGLRSQLGDAKDWRKLSALNCVECGERVNDVRRKALPGVKVCVDCQQQIERRSKR